MPFANYKRRLTRGYETKVRRHPELLRFTTGSWVTTSASFGIAETCVWVTIVTAVNYLAWYIELVAQIVSRMETTRLNQISSDKT